MTSAYTDTDFSGTMIADVSPVNPAPNSAVNIKVTSYATDLNRSTIVWSANGSTFTQGIGLRTVSVKVGSAGSKTTIRITAHTPEGATFAKDLSFSPAGIDLLWQAHTSVPPYYIGRALPTAGSNITIMAEPDFINPAGKRIDSANIVYEWSRNGNKLESASGYGKYYLDINNLSNFSNETISVKATDISGQLVAENTIAIPVLAPRLAIYEEDSLMGTKFETAITRVFNLFTEEVTLRGEPYFYPRISSTPAPVWMVNGEVTNTDRTNPSLITLREPTGKSGTAALVYNIDGGGNTRQSLQLPITINFGAKQMRF
ncbi:MAG: hypothetical protein WC764_02410 [Candidatus Paceibacterota bacterium]